MAELTDEEVFGSAANPREMTDADVFGDTSAQGAREAAARRLRGGVKAPSGKRETSENYGIQDTVQQGLYGLHEKTVRPLIRLADSAVSLAKGDMGYLPDKGPSGPVGRFYDKNVAGPSGNAIIENKDAPKTAAQSIGRAAGDMTGEALQFGTGVQGIANTGRRFGTAAMEKAPGIANNLRAIGDSVLEGTAKKPVRSMLGQIVPGAESGAMGEVFRQGAEQNDASPEAQRQSELIGQIAGPSVVQLFPGSLVTRAAKVTAPKLKAGADKLIDTAAGGVAEALPGETPAIVSKFLRDRAEKAATTAQSELAPKVQSELRSVLANPNAAANIAEAERLQTEIPGFKPGLARASGDQSLLNTQQHLDNKASGADLRGRQANVAASEKAITDKFETVVPPTPPTIGRPRPPEDTVANAANERVGRANQRLDQQEAAAQTELQRRTDTLPETDPARAGATMRRAYSAEEQASEAEVNRLRAAIANPETQVAIGPAATGPHPSLNRPAPTMSVNKILDRRGQINTEIRRYASATSRTPEDVARMEALSAERQNLDRAIEGVNLPGMNEYRTYYRDEHAPRFLEGAGRDVNRYKQFGYDKNFVADERVPSQFFAPNNISAARQFNRTFANDANMQREMTDVALDDLRRAAVNPQTGVLNPDNVNRWLAKNERVLNEMPWIREHVAALDMPGIQNRFAEIATRRAKIADTRVAQTVDKLGNAGQNSGNAIDAALKDPKLMRELSNSVRGNEEGTAALRRAVFERMKADNPDILKNPGKMLDWLKTNERSVGQVLTPEHRRAIEDIAKAAQIQGRAPSPAGNVGLPKTFARGMEDQAGTSVKSAIGSTLGVARGRSSKFVEFGGALGRLWNRNADVASQQAWDMALSNPDFAKLARDVMRTGKPTKVQEQRLRSYIPAAFAEGDSRQE